MSNRSTEVVAGAHLGGGQFFGDVLRKLRCSGLVLSELRHRTGRKLPRHSHDLAYFCLLLGGNYSESLGRKTLTYRPLTVVFHPPGMTHRDEVGGGGGHFFSVELEPRWLQSLGEYSAAPAAVTEARGDDLSWLATRLYREFRDPDASSPLALEGLVMAMLTDVARAARRRETRAPEWLARAVEMLHDEGRQSLTVARVALEVGVHPFHLSRVFKQFHGQTVGEYQNALRIRRACRELADAGTRLADVALRAGFSDQSHFTRAFKRATGMTPGAFRRTCGAGAGRADLPGAE
jgi:AraC family transcriptional regulator